MKIDENGNLGRINDILGEEFPDYDGSFVILFGLNDEKINCLTRNVGGAFILASRNYLNIEFLQPKEYYGE